MFALFTGADPTYASIEDGAWPNGEVKPVEYSYLIATGSPEEIRSVFYENRGFADNSSLVAISQSMR